MLREALGKLHQVKANFTPVGISAMEDFIGRGDRRIGEVIRRAWELGATNDSWWQSEEQCFQAWNQAIADVGMDWKYRQVESGEWDVLEALGDGRYRGQGGGGKGRVDRGQLADDRLDAPLPWDHIDTGIAKWWLKADLQRALEAATVPDCSHSGICTECGVCDDEEEAQERTEEGGGSGRGFGRNVVYEPPPIPEFEGHYRPNSTRAQRLRFRFSKTGDMVFVGHLDLIKTFDRACRRAALPISADESPFAVRQRIYAALPLPLGATSAGEWLEITLTERFEPEAIRSRLQAQLPGGLELLSAEEALVKKADGSNGEKMAQQLDSVEYYLVLDDQEADAPSSSSSSSSGGGSSPLARLTTAVAGALATPEFVVERSGGKKRGKKLAPTKVDLKWALQEMQACTPAAAAAGGVPAEVLPAASSSKAVVRVRTACANGNPVITPAMAIDMLNAAAAAGSGSNSSSTAAAAEAAAAAAQDGGDGSSDAAATSSGRYALAHLHRSEIRLRPMTVPQPDWAKLRSLVRMEGHLAAAQVSGSGPWASGLENRPRLE